MEEAAESNRFNFPQEEEKVLKYWEDINAFQEQLKRTEGKPCFTFYDGPPFATGLPHYGHILAGTLKDTVTRYASMDGKHVIRRFGWDCHGLPVEYEIDKKLGIKSKADVLKMGIGAYNEECRSIVMRYASEWEKTVRRLGRWIEFGENPSESLAGSWKTMNLEFMESVWWVFKQLHAKGLIYRGVKVMPYSMGCGTALSNFEAGLNYKECKDPAVYVAFPIKDDPDHASMVAWTTTPWTLPSNLALCVNPELEYVKCRYEATGAVYIVAEARFPIKVQNKVSKDVAKDWKILSKCKGKDLVGLRYEPMFNYFQEEFKDQAYRVLADDYVTATDGTGVVHIAPGFGEDDYRVSLAAGVVTKGGHVPCPVDDAGRFTQPVKDFAGVNVKEAEKDVTHHIKNIGRLVNADVITHSYPFCWRSDTPLIYRVIPSWFVKVEDIKDNLLKNVMKTEWVPSHIREGRFYNWLQNARDWAISRTRFWGTPLPVWANEDFTEVVVVQSRDELEKLTGKKINDLHRHFIDDLTIPSKTGNGVLRRIEDVFDCWFESGSMPYAHVHYPFENKEFFEKNFPADFISEGLDQTRGWFYTLMVLGTALFDEPPFRNVICSGLVLAADGKKMSKRLKNYPDPTEVIDKYGSDALRLYLINSPVVKAETLRFKEDGVFSVVKDVLLPWYNAYFMLTQTAVRLCREEGVAWKELTEAHPSANALDSWLATQLEILVREVRTEMTKYRVYNVVPALMRFIDRLTNVYVRLNRKRLKGKDGKEECCAAVSSLYRAMLELAQLMAPFTPFVAETMYQNLRKADPSMPESVHFCELPKVGDEPTQEALINMRVVDNVWTIIELARNLRDRHKVPVKTPLLSLTIASTDARLLQDISGRVSSYVKEEMNIWELKTDSDTTHYSVRKLEPNMALLGKKLGRDLGKVKTAMAQLSSADVAKFEREGQITLEGHVITREEAKSTAEYKLPAGMDPKRYDLCGITLEDGSDLVVVCDLHQTPELLKSAFAREVVNRLQNLRKKSGMVPGDLASFTLSACEPAAAEEELKKVLAETAASIENQVDGIVTYTSQPAVHGYFCAPERDDLNGWGSDVLKSTNGDVHLTLAVSRYQPRAVTTVPAGLEAKARLFLAARSAVKPGSKITTVIDGQKVEIATA